MSKDYVPVLFHGPYLETTTSGYGKLEAKRYEELNTLDSTYYIKTKKPNTHNSFSRLDEYLLQFGNHCYTNLEIKRDSFHISKNIEASIHRTVLRLGMQKRTFYNSFNWSSIYRIKKIAPEMGVDLLLSSKNPILLRFFAFCGSRLLRPDFIHFPTKVVTNSLLQQYLKKYQIVVWTENHLEKIRLLHKMGVSLVITDNMQAYNVLRL